MRPDRDTICHGLRAVFAHGTIVVVELGNTVEARIEVGDESASFTFGQMWALPAILGTEHLDFRTDNGSCQGSSWTGSYGHWTALVIEARYDAGAA